MKFKEDKGELPEYAGMGVNPFGDLIYKKQFVEEISDEELEGVLVHEILHLSLLHLLRIGSRDKEVWNIAADICVNQIIKDNNFKLPDGCLISSYENEIDLFGQKIKDCNKKTSEELYDEIKLPKNKRTLILISGGSGSGKGSGLKRFDEHIQGKFVEINKKGDKTGKGEARLTPEEVRKIQEYWKDKTEEAYVTAKMRGMLPAGIEKLVGKLHENKINWRTLLQRYIQSSIPYDFTFQTPHKKSVSAGYFMPNLVRECVDVVVAIDTSGSIGGEELNDFLSEILGMAKAFRGRIKLRVLTHDTDVHDDYMAENGSVEKIRNLKIHGGGGTSFKGIIEYLDKKRINPKLLIWLTDGYGDKIEKQKYQILWVLSNGGSDELLKDVGKVIELKEV